MTDCRNISFIIRAFIAIIVANCCSTAQAEARNLPMPPSHKNIEHVLNMEVDPRIWEHGRYALVTKVYEALLAPTQRVESVSRLSDNDLEDLFFATEGATVAADMMGKPEGLPSDLTLDLGVLQQRHLAGYAYYSSYYRDIVLSGRFTMARKFYKAHSRLGLPRLPEFPAHLILRARRKYRATVFTPELRGRMVSIHRVNLGAAAQVIILADPQCHFSAYFLNAMRGHPKLMSVLSAHATWVTPPDGILEARSLWSWNRKNPKERLSIISTFKEWPMIKVSALPSFFFLRRGRVVARFRGWRLHRDASRVAELRGDLTKVGLLH